MRKKKLTACKARARSCLYFTFIWVVTAPAIYMNLREISFYSRQVLEEQVQAQAEASFHPSYIQGKRINNNDHNSGDSQQHPLLAPRTNDKNETRSGAPADATQNNKNINNKEDDNNHKKKKNAYSFQIAPCDPDQEIAVYRHLVYSVYTAIFALQKHGSKADFHVWLEMVHASPHKKLPDEEERVFFELGNTYLHYIPTQKKQSLYRTQLQKFRILGLEQYSHVWHLDADVLPLTNLDYVFDLIDQGVLRKNVAFAEGHEPANGGSFIVSPRPYALKEINDIIYRREHKPWDSKVGWGHVITAPDRHVTVKNGEQTSWDFYGGRADQGLLLYWIKYVEKDVSFVLANGAIEHWGPSPPGQDENGRQPVQLLKVTKENALMDLEETLPKSICLPLWKTQGIDCNKPRPRRDYIRFLGWKKPWQAGLPKDYFNTETSSMNTPLHYWYSLFDEINQKHHLRVNLTLFTSMVELSDKGRWTGKYFFPPGYFPTSYRSNLVTPDGTFTTLIDDPPTKEKSAIAPSSSSLGGVASSTSTSTTGTDVVIAANQKIKKNAYTFQIGGVDPTVATPLYRQFLYGTYIAIYALKYKHGSTADFHVWIEMSHNSHEQQANGNNHSSSNKLPDEEERVFRELGAVVHYIPARPGQSFYRTQLQKFRMLGLEQYNHVWHLDADFMPLANLDYIFDLIDNGILRKNVAFLEGSVPAVGGSFVLTPRPGALREINEIIRQKELSKEKWNTTIGWGHEVKAPDRWSTLYGHKDKWNFHAADGDQGLLLYWIKYVEKDVSFLNIPRGRIEHWGVPPLAKGEVARNNTRQPVKLLEMTEDNTFQKLQERLRFPLPDSICVWGAMRAKREISTCDLPHPQRDSFHFMGKSKPWNSGLPEDYYSIKTQHNRTARHYWFSLLEEINVKYRLGLNSTTFGKKLDKFQTHAKGYAPFQMSQLQWKGTFTTLIDDDVDINSSSGPEAKKRIEKATPTVKKK